MTYSLPKRQPQIIIDDVLQTNDWTASNVRGYDTLATGTDAFLPAVTSLDDVNETHPSIVVTQSNETTPGGSYDYLTDKGAGRDLDGTVVTTVRAEADAGGDDTYTGDSSTYSATDAETIVFEIGQEIDRLVAGLQTGGSTPFYELVPFPAAQPVPDTDANPTVWLQQVTIAYSYLEDAP